MGRLAAARGRSGGGGAHDGGGSMRWLLTYADMITLLMAFFIMLYSMSILNLSRFQQVAVSIKSGFGGAVPGQGMSVLGATGQFGVQPSPIAGDTAGVPYSSIRKLQEGLARTSPESKAQMLTDERGLVVRLPSDTLLFEPGSATMRPAAAQVLAEVAEALREVPNDIRIEGHTCSLPTRSQRYPTNWELSTSRATEVVRYLITRERISPRRLSAAGYADQHPVARNSTAAGRAANRRVEIVLLRPNPMHGTPAETGESMSAY